MDWTQIIITLITLVLVPIITWLLSLLGQLARAKIAAITSASARTLLESALAEGEAAVATAVLETQQIYVAALKAAGGFTQAAADSALHETMARVKKIMSMAALTTIQNATGNLDTWIRSRIEAVVGEIKSVA